jgi:ATP-dependent DNA ligase
MKKKILTQKNSNGRIKFIELVLEGDMVSRVFGLVGGKTQNTSHVYSYINKNKSNELSPSQAAEADYNRIIATKTKEGYLITESLESLPDFDNDQMDFDDLPVQFCCSKPITKISKTKLNKMIKNKLVRFFMKYNGICSYILITGTGDVKIYSRRLDLHTVKYPTIVEAVKKLMYPPNTLLIVELVVDPTLKIPHMEGFKLIQRISKSDTLKGVVKENIDKTLALQEKTQVKAVVFNILFYHGDDLTKLSYDEVFEYHIEGLSNNNESFNAYIETITKDSIQDVLIPPTEFEFSSYDEAHTWVKLNSDKYEGLVVWERESNAEITYSGKPNRRACYKLKPVKDDDVVAYDWKEGTGAKQGKVGSLLIGKYNKEGDMVPMGNVGSGLKIKQGECEVDYWEFPCVIEILYDQRFPTGAYQFPRFNKVHENKIPSEIIVDEKGF